MTLNTRTMTATESTSTAHRLPAYDGACRHIHGHNIEWHLSATVDMDTATDGMVLDLKDLKGTVTRFDHAFIAAEDDPLVAHLTEFEEDFNIITIDGAPTCETLAGEVAERITDLDGVVTATVEVAETDKYTITTTSHSGSGAIPDDDE